MIQSSLRHNNSYYRFSLVWLIVSLLVLGCFNPADSKEKELYDYYKQITVEMSLRQLETVLGPGVKLMREQLPQTPGSNPVVRGDHFYRWGDPDRKYIIVGVVAGKIVDKWYWEGDL